MSPEDLELEEIDAFLDQLAAAKDAAFYLILTVELAPETMKKLGELKEQMETVIRSDPLMQARLLASISQAGSTYVN